MNVQIKEFGDGQVRVGVARVYREDGSIGWMDYTLKASGVAKVESNALTTEEHKEILQALEEKYFPKD